MFRLEKKILTLATVVVVAAFTLIGCFNNKNKVVEEKVSNITLILDKGGVQDGSFNEAAWTGAIKASEELENVEVRYLESTIDTDYTQNIETAVDIGSDLIIGVGFNLSQAIEDAALNYPDQQFAIIDGSFEEIPDNVTSILFNEKEAGYLAGLAVGKTVNSNKFGFVGGIEVPAVVNYKEGFERGLKEVNPNAELLTQYANSFTDASKGRIIAEQMISQGVSTICTAGGGVNVGVYEVCSEKGKYAVAVDMAQSYISPNTILTSAIKKVDVGVYQTIKEYTTGKLKGGVSHVYNISNDGVGYEDTKHLTDEVREFINKKIN